MRKLFLIAILLIPLCFSNIWAATELKVYVDPSRANGQTYYNSLSSAIVSNAQNLVTADKYFSVEISSAFSDTTAVSVTGYTTDATRYISIYTSGAARHSGTWDTTKYVHTGNIDTSSLTSLYITIDGIQQIINGTMRIYTYSAGSTIKNCIFNQTSAANANTHCLLMRNAGSVINCIFFKSGAAGSGGGVDGRSGTAVSNCTFHGFLGGTGVIGGSGGVVAKNIISYNNNADYSGTFGAASTNNLSKDTSAPALNTYYVSKTLTFVDAANGNFHLAATDTDAIGKGVDLSSSFTTDIDGQTWTTWGIGADFYYVASGSTPSIEEFIPQILIFGKLKKGMQ